MNGPLVRVLIVDDEPDSALTLGELLELRSYAVQVVMDSARTLDYLKSFNPDVLLLDIAMPKISGNELAKQIRMQSEFAKVSIIALSGYADGEHKRLSIEAGCDQYLVKPVRLATLEAAIAHELQKRFR